MQPKTESRANDGTLRAVEALSRFQRPLAENVNQGGPGGQAYDQAPTPPPREDKQFRVNWTERLLTLNDRLGSVAKNFPRNAKKPALIVGALAIGLALGHLLARTARRPQ